MNVGHDVVCPCCGARSATHTYRARDGNVDSPCYGARRLGVPNPHGEIFVCDICSWGFIHPLPAEDELIGRYRALAERDYLAEAQTRSIQFLRELDTLSGLLGGGLTSLLDVGCSYGLLLAAATHRDIRAVGLEPSADAAAYCVEQGFDARQGGFELLGPDERFDVIFLWDVLEHVISPSDALVSARRHARGGGVVSIVVPNRASMLARLMGERWWSIVDLHLHYPSPQGLDGMLRRAGFVPFHIGTHPKILTGAQIRRWMGTTGPRAVIAGLVPRAWRLTVDPRDQLLVRARAA